MKILAPAKLYPSFPLPLGDLTLFTPITWLYYMPINCSNSLLVCHTVLHFYTILYTQKMFSLFLHQPVESYLSSLWGLSYPRFPPKPLFCTLVFHIRSLTHLLHCNCLLKLRLLQGRNDILFISVSLVTSVLLRHGRRLIYAYYIMQYYILLVLMMKVT